MSARNLKLLKCLAAAALMLPPGLLRATIIQVADYDLGEPGSIGAAQPYNPLVDSIGGDNSIANWNADSTRTSVITTGLAAPGSTHALQISSNVGGGGTWYNSSYNGAAGLTDNWALDLWLRPDSAAGTYLGSTDGNGASQVGVRFWVTNATQAGTSLGGNTMGSGSTRLLMLNGSGFLGNANSTYTLGVWARVTLIRQSGTLNYYLNENLQDSAATSGMVNDIRLGAGYWAEVASNGAFDKMRVWTFDTTDSLSSVTQTVFQAVPEPASAGLIGLGAAVLGWMRRRTR